MQLNECGKIAHAEWTQLTERFSNFDLDVFQIMPNHMHGIISLRDSPPGGAGGAGFTPAHGFTPVQGGQPQGIAPTIAPTGNPPTGNPPTDPAPTVPDIVGAYKSLVAKGCLKIYKSKNKTMGKLWQRNYYEHIIRNERAYGNIARYIENNPAQWERDKFRPNQQK